MAVEHFASVHVHMCVCVCLHACVCEGGSRAGDGRVSTTHTHMLKLSFFEQCLLDLIKTPCISVSGLRLAEVISSAAKHTSLLLGWGFYFTISQQVVFGSVRCYVIVGTCLFIKSRKIFLVVSILSGKALAF